MWGGGGSEKREGGVRLWNEIKKEEWQQLLTLDDVLLVVVCLFYENILLFNGQGNNIMLLVYRLLSPNECINGYIPVE